MAKNILVVTGSPRKHGNSAALADAFSKGAEACGATVHCFDAAFHKLSGGECQRLKLAAALRQRGKIYILDEPSTGLHAQDVQRLLALLQSLVEQGHTVILVEHDLDLIAAADYVIDLGPGGGKHGGMLMFARAPSALLDCQGSVTAEFLRRQLPN